MIHIALYEPEIPSNTGNIGRTCLLTGSRLHLIRPLGFRLDDKLIRRSGLDYWKDVDIRVHDSYAEFLEYLGDQRLWIISTKGREYYHNVSFQDGDHFLFGRESSGLPEDIMEQWKHNSLRIPMIQSSTRSLNLANTAAILTYEAKRQLGFSNML
ncbi:MAG: tRNA (uridine(34)/cytosine(34)/5-carboxymethylaminomethyluridine(34)-2'-O)-methyltransferase TrmL [Tissierellia bacterium]|nr:tRNA (uridine(34)/cytosine(34)/5-carboxymethylaminomethyluridine(34)-2'-O)-methyltransferase TrmL [Tissierellia bacterium]